MSDQRMYMSSAILRLFKMDRNGNGNETENSVAECGWNATHGDELIRVSISAYIKKNKKCKNRVSLQVNVL